MIELDCVLPPGCLCDDTALLASQLQDAGALWLRADPASFELDGDAVQGWNDRARRRCALPAQPNRGNARLAPPDGLGRQALETRSQTNCGLVLPGVTQDATRCTMAVIHRPQPGAAARTLLTLNTRYHQAEDEAEAGYLYLSDDGEQLVAIDTDTDESLALTCPDRPDPDGPPRARLAIMGIAGQRLGLMRDGGAMVEITASAPPRRQGTADLFIGCRSHRKGLHKTLGETHLLEVIFWPGLYLPDPETAQEQAQLAALLRHFRWEY